MKKFLFLIVSVCFSVALFAQDINFTDPKGQKQGLWRTFYPNNALKSEGIYKNNKPQGLFKLYFPNGKIKAEMDYQADNKTCKAVVYDSLGFKVGEGTYVDKLKDGEWKYYSEDGALRSIENYSKGVLNGPYKIFYLKSNALMEEGTYVDGKREGEVKQYFSDGKLHSNIPHKNGLPFGPAVFYYPDGTKKAQGAHDINGKRHGLWVQYNSKGVPERKVMYRHGGMNEKDMDIITNPLTPIKVNTPDGIKE